MLATSVMIYLKSPTNLYENNPCLYLLTFGLAIAKITNRLVVAQMTRHEVKTLDTVMIGPLLLILNQYFNILVNEYYVLWFALVSFSHSPIAAIANNFISDQQLFSIFDVLWFACKVCHEIRDHLHINIFSINPRPPKPPSSDGPNGSGPVRHRQGTTIHSNGRGHSGHHSKRYDLRKKH